MISCNSELRNLTREEELRPEQEKYLLDANEYFYGGFEKLVESLVHNYKFDGDSARDVVQESAVKAFTIGLHRYKPINSLQAYFSAILRHTAIDLCNKNKRRIGDVCEDIERYPQKEQDGVELDLDEILRILSGAPKQIGIEELVMHSFHGLDYQEIADHFNEPIGTVRSRISRAKVGFRDYFREHPELVPEGFSV